MPIPNEVDAAYRFLAKLDSRDLEIVSAVAKRTGVVSGCAVTAQGTPDMTVAVAAGLVMVEGKIVSVSAGNLTISATAANPRTDLIVVDNTGAKSVVAGTAAASPGPYFPSIPANSVVLALVATTPDDPTTTTINSNQIVDKRQMVSAHGAILATKTSDTPVGPSSDVETVVFTGTVPGGLLAAGDVLRAVLHGNNLNNSGSALNMHYRTRFGTTLLTSTPQAQSTSANRTRWTAVMEMVALSTTAQRSGISIPVAQATATNPFGPHTYVFSGTGATAEDTATDKTFEWRLKMDTAHALAEMVAHSGYLQLYKASG
jgi:hypothetical protein